MTVIWDPGRYRVYADERSRPFFDLTSRVRAQAPRGVVDLGCGTGELTASLADRWPDARVHGIDSSPQMIARARTASDDRVTFELADLATWMPSPDTDVVVSNAALQWVPEHRTLLARWAHALRSGAWLAWQVPGNFEAPSHRLMRELADSPRWRPRLENVLRHGDAVDEPSAYLRLLQSAGFEAETWETTYLHVLTGDDPVLEWVRGTGLRPILQALSPADAASFETEYAQALREAYPAGPYGTEFAFRRVFAAGRKR
jgi:trans-aconitate 2-methyltransferase